MLSQTHIASGFTDDRGSVIERCDSVVEGVVEFIPVGLGCEEDGGEERVEGRGWGCVVDCVEPGGFVEWGVGGVEKADVGGRSVGQCIVV